MAQVYYGTNLDQNIDTAVVGTSTANTDIEIRVNTANIPNRADFEAQLRNLIAFALIQNYPYA